MHRRKKSTNPQCIRLSTSLTCSFHLRQYLNNADKLERVIFYFYQWQFLCLQDLLSVGMTLLCTESTRFSQRQRENAIATILFHSDMSNTCLPITSSSMQKVVLIGVIHFRNGRKWQSDSRFVHLVISNCKRAGTNDRADGNHVGPDVLVAIFISMQHES
jgi:hypothetical protein